VRRCPRNAWTRREKAERRAPERRPRAGTEAARHPGPSARKGAPIRPRREPFLLVK
jgi:hypothetical protein